MKESRGWFLIEEMCWTSTIGEKMCRPKRRAKITKLIFHWVIKQMGECQQGRRSVPADVASPRPREVGGACRIQVLAGARTRETVGGSNEAARSEFRRNWLPGRCETDHVRWHMTDEEWGVDRKDSLRRSMLPFECYLSVLDFAESERPCNFVGITTLRKK